MNWRQITTRGCPTPKDRRYPGQSSHVKKKDTIHGHWGLGTHGVLIERIKEADDTCALRTD